MNQGICDGIETLIKNKKFELLAFLDESFLVEPLLNILEKGYNEQAANLLDLLYEKKIFQTTLYIEKLKKIFDDINRDCSDLQHLQLRILADEENKQDINQN